MAGELDRRRDLSIARALATNPRTPSGALVAWVEQGTGGWRTLAREALHERAKVAAEGAAGAVLSGTERIGAGIESASDRAADELDDVLGRNAHPKVA